MAKQHGYELRTVKAAIDVNHEQKTLLLKKANVCFVFTEWGEIKAVTPTEYKELMMTPLVYDGRNLYDLDGMKENGVEYYSIGR